MKLDRNITKPRRGKYALIKLREDQPVPDPNSDFHSILRTAAIDYGDTPETDFFVIRLKDKYAFRALAAYAAAAMADDPEYAGEIGELALLALNNPHQKRPD